MPQMFLLVLCGIVTWRQTHLDMTLWSWPTPIAYFLIMGVPYIPTGLYLRWRNMRRDWLKYHLIMENFGNLTVALVLLLMILLDTNVLGGTLWERRLAMIGLFVLSMYFHMLARNMLEMRFRPKDV
ncbi:hypothetical protein KBC54_00025 [Patescibacteria group bacterium]|nr:hypothetical protein [Patescibacteria group bacterium]